MRALVVLDERWNSALTDLGIKIGSILKCQVAFALLKGYPAHKRLEGKGYPLFFIEDPRRGIPLKAFLSLKKALYSFRPNVVLTIRGDEMLFASLLKGKLGYSLFRLHGSQRGMRNSFLNRLIHRKFVDGVILSTRKFLTSVVSEIPKIVINGLVDTKEFSFSLKGRGYFREKLKVKGKKLIGVVGRLDPVKGHSLFLKALSKLKRDDFLAVVVGNEENVKLKDLVNLRDSLGLKERVLFIPERIKEIKDFMSACDLGVVPSLGSEVVLRVPLEFMACRTALVSTNVGALPEVVSPPFGICVPPKEDSLACAINKMLDEDLNKLGLISQEVAVEKYSLESNSPLINNFLCSNKL